MSLTLSSLSRTATPRLSRSLLTARPLSPRYRTPQWQTSAPLSISHPIRSQPPYPYGRPQISTPLMSRIFYKPDGRPRSKLKGLGIAGVTVFSLIIWFAALRAVAETEVENELLKCLVQVQHAIYKLPFVDVDDPLTLLDVIQAITVSFKDEDDSPAEIAALFGELEAYLRRHATEMKGFKITFAERHKILEISHGEPYSAPVKAKILLAAYLFATLERVRKDDMEVGETLTQIGTTLQQVIEALVKIVADEKGIPEHPDGGTGFEVADSDKDFEVVG